MSSGLKDISNYDHEKYMQVAIEEAKIAGGRGDKPIAAVLVHNHKIIGKMSNTWNTRNSKVHHAENYLILENAQYLRKHGKECIIYTTLEPCLMCIGTIVMADIRNVVVGLEDKYMQTKKFIDSHNWLKDRIFNFLVGIKENECKELINRYGSERDKSILL
ncbi:MAG: nucleoside deaminase [Firmicutes bacterium]|nr:nucleoside deaminase [Bacillota bacterium]